MDKKHFVIHLFPSRPDFATTMSDEERSIMQAHTTYWMEYMNKGVMLVFGPVLHPQGAYGLGIIAVESEEAVQPLLNNDPATSIARYEYFPMMAMTPATQANNSSINQNQST
jgi:uncharacterized protein YciI